MIENIFLALTLLLAAAPKTPGVEITFTDGAGGAAHTTRYRLPLPLDNQSSRLHLRVGGEDVSLRTLLIHDKSGASWLDYEVHRGSAPPNGEVNVSGAVALPTGGAVTIGEWDGSRVQLDVKGN